MGLAEDLSSIPARKLTLTELIDGLDDEDRKVLIDVLQDPSRRGSEISRVLQQHGYEIGVQAVNQWRRTHVAR